jgi:hypothetical protein
VPDGKSQVSRAQREVASQPAVGKLKLFVSSNQGGVSVHYRGMFLGLMGVLSLAAAGSAQAQEKAARKSQGTATLFVLNMCTPMAQLTGWVTGPTASVKVDGKAIGTVEPCSFKSFSVPAGDREVIIRTTGFELDLGFPGPRHNLVAGQSTYISAVYRQYFETRQIDAGSAKQSMDVMRSVRKK